MARKRIKTKLKHDKIMQIQKRINDKRKELSKYEYLNFQMKIANKHPEIFA